MAGTAAAGPTQALGRLEAGTTTGEALSFFDSLPPVTVAGLIGAWRGSELASGHCLDGLLDNLGWHGKRFDGPDRAYPLIFDGRRGRFSVNPALVPAAAAVRYSRVLRSPLFPGPLFFGLARPALRLLRTSRPTARLRMMEYRGVLTGTMCYDALAANDHFRQVSQGVLLGAMDLRGLADPYLFVLRRETPAGS